MVSVRRPIAVSLAVSAVLVAAVCSWPLTGAWAVAVAAGGAAAVLAAVGVAAWRRRSARAGVSALLAQLPDPPTVEGVQSALRTALADPTAAVFYQLPDGAGLVSATGEGVDVPVSDPGQHRRFFPARGHGGEVVAMLSVSRSANVDPGRVETALVACGPALENARLQAILHSHLRAARASRTRIVQAALAERRKLARDLHDGAQQHLHAVSASLGMAQQVASQPPALAAINSAREQLRVALGKLRGLGRDLYPVLLDSEGLTAALESLADDAPLDVDVVSRTGRQDPEAEIIMYLTAREVLAGLAEHAEATHAVVAVIAADGHLSLRVTSDGRRADETDSPAWLSIIIDRVEADGGEVSVKSGSEPMAELGGICVEASIPCG